MYHRLLESTATLSRATADSIRDISAVTRSTFILSVNARIEAARAGEHGRGFAVVASEVGSIASRVQTITDNLSAHLAKVGDLNRQMMLEMRGQRLADLSLNMIEIIDRNLYERSCDVRWWATDAAVVDCLANPSPEQVAHTSTRLGVILDAYTVYLDIWLASPDGTVLATGRPDKFRAARTTSVARERWFRDALATRSGADYVAGDIAPNPALSASVATYATAVREGGRADGKVLGVLGIFFDWQSQSQLVVDRVRLTDEERPATRTLLLDSRHRVIASSDRRGLLSETFPLRTDNRTAGFYADGPNLVGFALTPGYETYPGLGWWGVTIQSQTL